MSRNALQDGFLRTAQVEKTPLTVILTNGFQQRGFIKAFDDYSILLIHEEKQHLIYKHAISTIVPLKQIEL